MPFTLHIFAPLSCLYLWLWGIKISWLLGMMAFNVTIHAKFLKNLFRGAELELEEKAHKCTAREWWNQALTFPFLEMKASQQRKKSSRFPASNFQRTRSRARLIHLPTSRYFYPSLILIVSFNLTLDLACRFSSSAGTVKPIHNKCWQIDLKPNYSYPLFPTSLCTNVKSNLVVWDYHTYPVYFNL